MGVVWAASSFGRQLGLEAFIVGMAQWLLLLQFNFPLIKQLSRREMLASPGTFLVEGGEERDRGVAFGKSRM